MALTIKEEVKQDKIIVDLTGEHGNAFYILGLAKKLSQQFSIDFDAIKSDMTSKDYGHLIRTFEQHFGLVVELQMSKEIMKQVNPFHNF